MPGPAISSIDLPGIPRLRSGKVREVFDLGEALLFVATDRLSAFDVILPDPIPGKGAVLNQISAFWFRHFRDVENHLITEDYKKFPESLCRSEINWEAARCSCEKRRRFRSNAW